MDDAARERRGDWMRIALLLMFAATVRFWLLAHTEVPARDSIGFMRFALRLESTSWGEACRASHQMPLYPLAILAVSHPMRFLAGEMSCNVFVYSAQLVSILASLAAIVPMYFAGRALFGRNAGLLAAAMFQAFPVCMRVTSDGLSEGLFFLWLTTGVYCAVTAFQKSSLMRFALCGVMAGLAYLTRPEGAELAVATCGAILALALVRREWKAGVLRLAAVSLGAMPLAALYVGATGQISRKPTAVKLLNSQADLPTLSRVVHSPILMADFWDPKIHGGQSRAMWTAATLIGETLKATLYYGLVLALVGIWFFWRRMLAEPGLLVLLLIGAIHVALLMRVTAVSGYLSERHAMVPAFLCCFWAGGAIARLVGHERAWKYAWAAATGALLIAGLPSSARPLHGNRAGNRQCGEWLAGHLGAADQVHDPMQWAYFYSGSVFREFGRKPAAGEIGSTYVVIDVSGNSHERLPTMPLARTQAQAGVPVYHWPESVPFERARMAVFKVQPATVTKTTPLVP